LPDGQLLARTIVCFLYVFYFLAICSCQCRSLKHPPFTRTHPLSSFRSIYVVIPSPVRARYGDFRPRSFSSTLVQESVLLVTSILFPLRSSDPFSLRAFARDKRCRGVDLYDYHMTFFPTSLGFLPPVFSSVQR